MGSHVTLSAHESSFHELLAIGEAPVSVVGSAQCYSTWQLNSRAMPARYMLSSCVRPSQAGTVSKRLDESSWFLTWRLPFIYHRLCCKEVWVFTTRSSAIAEGPRDASCQLKSCQLPATVQKLQYLYDKSWPNRWYEVGDLVRQCVIDNVHSTMTRSSLKCYKQTDHGPSYVYHRKRPTDDLLWRNFLSLQCRNSSRNSDHAHLRNTHSSHD